MACILASKAARCWPSSPKSSWANHEAYSVNNNQTPRMWYGWWGRDICGLRMVDFLRTLFVEIWVPQKHVRSWDPKKWMEVGDSWNAVWHLRATPHTWAISSISMGSPACIKTKTCNLKMKSSSKSSWLWVPSVSSRGCLKQYLSHILSLQASKTVQKLPLRAMNMAVLIQKQREFLPIRSPMLKQHKT